MPKNFARKSWTDSDVARLRAMKAEGLLWEEIGAALGRTGDSCCAKFHQGSDPDSAKRYVSPPAPPLLLAASARRREAADRRDLTARLCGDPPPGYSALDKIRRGVRA